MAAVAALKEQLKSLVNSMFVEGLLEEQFSQLQMLQDESNPNFVAEVVTIFCRDSERILTELANIVDQPVVDFQKVGAFVHQLKGSSSSVGARQVKLACVEFRRACEGNDREGQVLQQIQNEYLKLRSKFDAMLQLEQRILAYDSKRQ